MKTAVIYCKQLRDYGPTIEFGWFIAPGCDRPEKAMRYFQLHRTVPVQEERGHPLNSYMQHPFCIDEDNNVWGYRIITPWND